MVKWSMLVDGWVMVLGLPAYEVWRGQGRSDRDQMSEVGDQSTTKIGGQVHCVPTSGEI